MDLDGKIAIVTGASRGVGKTMALGLVKKVGVVVVEARTEVGTPPLPGSIQLTVCEETRICHGRLDLYKSYKEA